MGLRPWGIEERATSTRHDTRRHCRTEDGGSHQRLRPFGSLREPALTARAPLPPMQRLLEIPPRLAPPPQRPPPLKNKDGARRTGFQPVNKRQSKRQNKSQSKEDRLPACQQMTKQKTKQILPTSKGNKKRMHPNKWTHPFTFIYVALITQRPIYYR